MFKFMMFGMHFSPMLNNTIDPMVIELMREERLLRAADEHAAALAKAREYASQDEQETRKAA